MKLSLITAVYNRAETLPAALASVAEQQCPTLEYVVIDGMSSDGTADVIERQRGLVSRSVREPDSGLYDALNKGIRNATGDVIGFLHADDMFFDNTVLNSVAAAFEDPAVDAVYGDLCYVDTKNPDRIVRYWKAGTFEKSKFRYGWMPPHPTVYLRRTVFENYGGFRLDFGSAADYECMLRHFYKHDLRVKYIPKILVKMRQGGESNASIWNRIRANRYDWKAWEVNGLRPPLGLRFSKPLRKIVQYFSRPNLEIPTTAVAPPKAGSAG